MAQKDVNPYPYSDSNKRYQTYEYWLRKTFGGKCAKIPLDGGFTCPNMDGTCGTGGCIYCSKRGSGDFAPSVVLPLAEQYRQARVRLAEKWSVERCIPYFQAHTNTYAPVDILRKMFEEALTFEGVVGLNISTRADCLPRDTVEYLADLARRTVLTVELGLQTVHNDTAARINRGHTFTDFLDGYRRLCEASPKILTCIHLIFGLPGEDHAMMMDTVHAVAALHPTMVKIHLLHVLRGTVMEDMYRRGDYIPMEREDYIRTVVDALELLPMDTVVARLTGDGAAEDLLAPRWSRAKREALNDIDRELYRRGSWQGARYVQ